ncbi:benzoate/H(+) symporter BenE family transporter [Oricola sp.]|uniref:benzoate/H(+) symporter BenE family transporter n=1 Tax=Oricola sp. TaxID=1979950 RepID=UPI0035147FB9
MRLSLATNAVVAALIGFAVTLPLIFQAGKAIGASDVQTAMFVTVSCFAVAIESAYLSWRYKIPVVCAFSTAGLALIGASDGFTISDAAGALIATGLMIVVTGLVRPFTTLVAKIPGGIAAGMLAGVLLPFVLGAAQAGEADPGLVLPLTVLYFAVRLWNGAYAILAVLAAGIAMSVFGGATLALPAPGMPEFELLMPTLSLPSLIGIAIPLYLVTMASQNLPGLAVLRADGYAPPAGPLIAVTGMLSTISGLFAAITTNLAAITAAICTGLDTHPDSARRWITGLWYGVCYALIGLFGVSLVAIVTVLPTALIALVVGLGLLNPLINATMIAMKDEDERVPAMTTLIVTASGVAFFGIGSAFWGLVAGLTIFFSSRPVWRKLQ